MGYIWAIYYLHLLTYILLPFLLGYWVTVVYTTGTRVINNPDTAALHRGTCHVISRTRNDDLALCLWVHEVWGTISRNPLEIETWVQWNTNRKWYNRIRMVMWVMSSRDPERSRSWPRYIWGPLSRLQLEIGTWCQWSTYSKWLPGNQMVTWPMTSRDPKGQDCPTYLV